MCAGWLCYNWPQGSPARDSSYGRVCTAASIGTMHGAQGGEYSTPCAPRCWRASVSHRHSCRCSLRALIMLTGEFFFPYVSLRTRLWDCALGSVLPCPCLSVHTTSGTRVYGCWPWGPTVVLTWPHCTCKDLLTRAHVLSCIHTGKGHDSGPSRSRPQALTHSIAGSWDPGPTDLCADRRGMGLKPVCSVDTPRMG